MIARTLAATLEQAARLYPAVTVIGPRQSGKTTLCRAVFPDLAYVSLERLDMRELARSDPRGFLAEFSDGAILDEVQRAPELLGYLQVELDEHPEPGRFILTGSEHLVLSAGISQSLAGRTAVLHLLPPGLEEIRRFPSPPASLLDTLVTGAYPRIHDRGIPPDRWLADYVATYVQRDVRQILNVGDLQTFTTFVRLCAGRTAQEVNLSSLGADCGISHNTARSWLSILETSYLVFRLPPWARSHRKRLVKAPKLHWLDSGLVCHLLGIESAAQLAHHPLRGAVFESWVVSEIVKAHLHRGVDPRLHHVRQTRGLEIDLVVERGRVLFAIECKSGSTVHESFLGALRTFRSEALLDEVTEEVRLFLVYGGEEAQSRSDADVVSWERVADVDWTLRAGESA